MLDSKAFDLNKAVKALILVVIAAGIANAQAETVVSTKALNNAAKVLAMPKMPLHYPKISGNVVISVKIELKSGKVVLAKAIAGHAILRQPGEVAARQTEFEPILQEFENLYASGVLVYKIPDFGSPPKINENPSPIFRLIDLRNTILNGKTSHLEKPVYPTELAATCAYGKVEVLSLIKNSTGKIIRAKAISGDEKFFRSAENATQRSTFTPVSHNGDVLVIGKIVYNFPAPTHCSNNP